MYDAKAKGISVLEVRRLLNVGEADYVHVNLC